jgi:hypothetical protein
MSRFLIASVSLLVCPLCGTVPDSPAGPFGLLGNRGGCAGGSCSSGRAAMVHVAVPPQAPAVRAEPASVPKASAWSAPAASSWGAGTAVTVMTNGYGSGYSEARAGFFAERRANRRFHVFPIFKHRR